MKVGTFWHSLVLLILVSFPFTWIVNTFLGLFLEMNDPLHKALGLTAGIALGWYWSKIYARLFKKQLEEQENANKTEKVE